MSSIAFQPFAAVSPTPNSTTTSGTSGTTGTSSSSSSSQTSIDALGSTFLNLLTEELQNQDPTAPMDSTAMVGQMISLNQLDQIASINQLLTSTLGSTTSSTANATANNNAASAASTQQAALLAAQATLQNSITPATNLNASALPSF